MDVAGMSVRIVESHEEVLGDWAEAARAAGGPLTLVTFDRHLDTAPALAASHRDEERDDDASLERRQKRILARYRGASPEDLEPLVEQLANDEHIDAALRLGFLDRVLIVSSQAGRSGDRPLPRTTVHRPVCAPGCVAEPHDDAECARRRFDAILETALLGPALTELGLEDAASGPYVLDIDLDTFATRAGLRPGDAAAFHALIAGAMCVTIAREPEYVNESLDDHDADEIEAALVQHVRRAMTGG